MSIKKEFDWDKWYNVPVKVHKRCRNERLYGQIVLEKRDLHLAIGETVLLDITRKNKKRLIK